MKFLRSGMFPLAGAFILLAAVVAIPLLGTAHAASSLPAPSDPIPKGVWNVTVLVPQGKQEHNLALFFPGTARKGPLSGGAYTQTDSRGTGLGDWEQTSGTAFEVVYVKQIIKALADGQQVYAGTVHVHCIDRLVSPTYYLGQCERVQSNPSGQVVDKSKFQEQAWFVPDSDPNWF